MTGSGTHIRAYVNIVHDEGKIENPVVSINITMRAYF
jgi:hypothetical protein